ncbi:hypothetical protein SPWS13_0096 [Shewanella putrefaciens]|nr:hypothetical protein SPWS13_0096 [Shewanella putrefaciens]
MPNLIPIVLRVDLTFNLALQIKNSFISVNINTNKKAYKLLGL